MITSRIEASRGYGGCRHASISRSRSMIKRSHRGYRCNQAGGFRKKTIRVGVLYLLILAITLISMHITTAENQHELSSAKTLSMYYEIHNKSMISPILQASAITSVQPKFASKPISVSASSMELMKSSIDDTPAVVEIDVETMLNNNLGSNSINVENSTLTKYDLPDVYYPGIDFSSFQPYMDYRCITNKSTPAYKVSHSELSYSDQYGLRRFQTTDDQFTIDGQDDYVIALGTFYKEKGTAGSRYLIVTTTGMYTAIAGDEKSDAHTDNRHMFSQHSDGSCAGIVEWIVDQKALEPTMKRAGTITAGPVESLKGEILYIYGIQ